MKMGMLKRNLGVLLLLLLLCTACEIPASTTDPAAQASATPNLTLTEWFRPTTGKTPTPEAVDTEEAAEEVEATPTATEEMEEEDTEAEDDTDTPSETATLIPGESPDGVEVDDEGDAAQITSEYIDDAPVIDGDLDEWSGTEYLLDKVVSGNEFYANQYDLSGNFKIAWDMEYLYLGVRVWDTQFVQTSSGAQLWMGDSLEVLLDADWFGDLNEDELSADDFQLGFSPGNLREVAVPEAYLWAPTDDAAPLEDTEVAGSLTEDGYTMEVAISWEELGITPEDGLTLGFLLSISDNDSIGQNAQQTVVSFRSERALHNPSTWAPLFLLKP